MPNWCLNNVTFTHDDPEKLEELLAAYKRRQLFDHYIPSPREENGDLSEDWFDWRVENWGTKWDVGGEDAFFTHCPKNVVLSFDSAWAPPIAFYDDMVTRGFSIRASYFEPGLAFCGIWEDGVDNYIEYGGSSDYKQVIPAALWEEFNMEEFFELSEEEAT